MSFVFAAMPITIIRGLQISIKKKFGLCILLGLGFFVGICSAVKTAQLLVLSSRRDLTWDTYTLWLWSFIENALVIVCGCIPTLKPLYDKLIKGTPIRPSRSHHNGKGPHCHGMAPHRPQGPAE
ncbi:hypothetical protein N7G274_006194 [Stereocaulon virgatum]|uniref:Rhodopsin domain-containing protein n=1 Tax=Stereocaulon virgatum TaxID=373712 RepID=A0ABR4A5R7_9LECA